MHTPVPLIEHYQKINCPPRTFGHCDWESMPFCLCNATAIIQRVMNHNPTKKLQLLGGEVMRYVNEINIANKTVEGRFVRLGEVIKLPGKA